MSVLIVLGWFPSNKMTKELIHMYNEFGYTDITVFNYGLPHAVYMQSLKTTVVESFRKTTKKRHFTIAHVLSGGYYPFTSLLTFHNEIKRDYIILDSTPIDARQENAIPALEFKFPFFISNMIGKTFELYWSYHKTFINNLHDKINCQNAICLIGEDDRISPHYIIREITPSLPIIMFPKCSHLQSLYKHKDLYYQTIHNFIMRKHSKL